MTQPANRKPLVYLAGPISSDPLGHTHEAIGIADNLLAKGFVPFVPHLSVLWQMIKPKQHAEWLEMDFEILRRCDALLRIPGESIGADMEVVFAKENGIPVMWTIESLLDWKLTLEAVEAACG